MKTRRLIGATVKDFTKHVYVLPPVNDLRCLRPRSHQNVRCGSKAEVVYPLNGNSAVIPLSSHDCPYWALALDEILHEY